MGLLDAPSASPALARSAAANSRVFAVAGAPVTNRLIFPNQGLYSASSPTITYRSSHVLLRAGNVLRLLWINQSFNLTAANAFTLTASLQVGTTQGANLVAIAKKQITFGGSTSVVIPPGGYALSDPVFVSYEVGNFLFVRSCCASAAGSNNWPIGLTLNRGNEGSASGDQTMADTSFSAANGFAPSMICGPSTDGKFVYGLGDSILDGSNDASNNRGFFDFWQLATNLAGARSAHPGETAATATSRFVSARMIQALGATHALCQYGTNDIGGGASLATVQASLIANWRDLWLLGVKVYQTTVIPRPTSTDSWITAANQTPYSADATRTALNDWLRAGAPCAASGTTYVAAAIGALGAVPCPYLTGTLDLCASVEVNASNALTTNGGRLLVGSTLRAATVTGGSASSITDTNTNFNALARPVEGCLVRITAGQGSGQTSYVVGAATNTQINVSPSFSTAPNNTSTYEIIDTPTKDNVHPSANLHRTMGSWLATNFSP